MNRNRVILIAVACLALVAAVALEPWASPQPPPVASLVSGPVIANVDGQPLYLSQAQNRYDSFASIHDMGLSDAEFQKQVLDSLMKDIALEKGAAAQGISISPVELALYVAGVVGPMSQDGDISEQLKQMGLTLPELEHRVYINFLGARLYQKITQNGLSLSEKEIRAYFDEHRSDYPAAPGEDPLVVYNGAKQEIAQALIKQKQDDAWSKWFDGQVEGYQLDIVMEDWWNQIKRESPQTGAAEPAATPSAAESPQGT